MFWPALLVFSIGYLFGSFPTGYLAGKVCHVDIREHGSGNIGATNALRVLGKPWGYSVFSIDALKGFLAVRISLALVAVLHVEPGYAEFFAVFAAASCVFGHSFPVWLGFEGGKGVATSVGALLGVMPIAAISIFVVWVVMFLATRYVSVASIAGALALPVTVWVLGKMKMNHSLVLLYFSIAMSGLVVWRHRSNIVRLLNGTEQRFARK